MVIGYDSLGRKTMHREGSGATLKTSRGFEYDARSRVSAIHNLSSAAVPDNWGTPVLTTRLSWDGQDRVVGMSHRFGPGDFDTDYCRNPAFRFQGKNFWRWVFLDTVAARPDTSIREYIETVSGPERLVYRSTQWSSHDMGYIADEGLDTASGSCYGPENSYVQYRILTLDAGGNAERTVDYRRRKGEPVFKEYPPMCHFQDYDDRGNRIKDWLFGECERKTPVWEGKYNEYNRVVEETFYESSSRRVVYHEYELLDLDTLPPLRPEE